MAITVEQILLKVRGDTGDAQRELEGLAKDLAIFSKESAEAEVTVDADQAKRELDIMARRLQRMDEADATPEVHAQIGQALIELGVIERELDKMDGRNVNVDVDIQRGAMERLNALSNSMFGLTRRFGAATDATEGWLSKLGNFRVALGPLAGPLSEIGPIVAILIPLITSLAAAVVALGASLGAAIAGAGALAVALGGVLLPAVGLVVAGIARFKDQSDVAGSAANELKTAFSGIGDAAKTLLPAVDPVFRALATGITNLKPLIGALKPAFMDFGQAAAGAVQQLGTMLASPAIVGGIQALISQAGAALSPLVSIAGNLFRILLNIANAAMPALVGALKGIAGGFSDFAKGTGDIGALRGAINGLVAQLGSWLALIGSVAGVLLELGKIAAPFGKELVDSFTKGTEGIRNFLKSAEGSEKVKQFFADVMPLVQALIPVIAQLALAFIQIGQFLAPVLTPIVKGLGDFLTILNVVLSFLNNNISPGIRGFIGTLAALALPIGAAARGAGILKVAFMAIPAILSVVGGAVSGVVSAFSSMVGAVVGAASRVIGAVRSGFTAIPGIIAGVVGTLAGIVRGGFQAAVGVIRGIASAYLGAARAVGQAVVNGIRGGISAVSGAVRAAMNAAVNAVRAVVGAAAGAARAVIQGVANALRGGASAVSSAMRSAANAGVSAVRGLAGAFRSAGEAVMNAFGDGIIAAGQAVLNKVSSIANSIKDKLPGSEPKDKSSPFTRLDKSGEAFVMNFVAGIDNASPLLADAVRRLGMITPEAGAAVAGTTIGPTTNQFLIETPSGEAPDTDTMLAQIEMRMRSRGLW